MVALSHWLRCSCLIWATIVSSNRAPKNAIGSKRSGKFIPDDGINWFSLRPKKRPLMAVGKPFIPGEHSPFNLYNKPEVLDPYFQHVAAGSHRVEGPKARMMSAVSTHPKDFVEANKDKPKFDHNVPIVGNGVPVDLEVPSAANRNLYKIASQLRSNAADQSEPGSSPLSNVVAQLSDSIGPSANAMTTNRILPDLMAVADNIKQQEHSSVSKTEQQGDEETDNSAALERSNSPERQSVAGTERSDADSNDDADDDDTDGDDDDDVANEGKSPADRKAADDYRLRYHLVRFHDHGNDNDIEEALQMHQKETRAMQSSLVQRSQAEVKQDSDNGEGLGYEPAHIYQEDDLDPALEPGEPSERAADRNHIGERNKNEQKHHDKKTTLKGDGDEEGGADEESETEPGNEQQQQKEDVEPEYEVHDVRHDDGLQPGVVPSTETNIKANQGNPATAPDDNEEEPPPAEVQAAEAAAAGPPPNGGGNTNQAPPVPFQPSQAFPVIENPLMPSLVQGNRNGIDFNHPVQMANKAPFAYQHPLAILGNKRHHSSEKSAKIHNPLESNDEDDDHEGAEEGDIIKIQVDKPLFRLGSYRQRVFNDKEAAHLLATNKRPSNDAVQSGETRTLKDRQRNHDKNSHHKQHKGTKKAKVKKAKKRAPKQTKTAH